MKRSLRPVLFPTLFLATLLLAAPSSAGERALVADLDGSGRDAIVVRSEEGEGAIVFLPTADGGFTRSVYPAMGADVASLTLVDADRDGAQDLVVARASGDAEVWHGDGHGAFLPPVARITLTHHGGHHESDPAEIEGARGDLEAARALVARPDLPSTRAGATESTQDLEALPLGFAPRLAATGRFLDDGGTGVAVVGGGSRPRLMIFAAGSTGIEAGREPLIPTTTVNVQVGQGGLNFVPATVNIQLNDTVHWVWAATGHNVVSGTVATCTANSLFCSPSNTNCNGNPTSSAGATYDRVFASSGSFPYFCRPHCPVMAGTVNVAAPPASPGAVPNGTSVPGTPLIVGKSGSDLMLSWGSSCAAGATDYAVYEGTLPIVGVYNHVAKNCSLGNVASALITPANGNRYYLVVAETALNEGSYGRGTAGEISVGAGACHPQLLGGCP